MTITILFSNKCKSTYAHKQAHGDRRKNIFYVLFALLNANLI